MVEELGWEVPLKKFGKINYEACVCDLYENEKVHCFYSQLDTGELPVDFNTDVVKLQNG